MRSGSGPPSSESAAYLSATERLVISTGIANIHARIPSPPRPPWPYLLTLLYPAGSCSASRHFGPRPLVKRFGVDYDKPLATMRNYLERMAALPEIIEPGSGLTRVLAAGAPKDG